MAATDGTVWAAGLIALVAAVPLWKITIHIITIAHEGGHATFAGLMGDGVGKVTLSPKTGGVTWMKGGGWFARLFFYLGGYLGPSLYGIIGAWMLAHGIAPRTVLLTSLVLLAVLLINVRSFFGFIAVPLTGLLMWMTAMQASAGVQKVVAYAWVWFLLIGSVRQIPMLFRVVRTKGAEEPDTGGLKKATGLPRLFFVALFLFGSIVALIYGGRMLLRLG